MSGGSWYRGCAHGRVCLPSRCVADTPQHAPSRAHRCCWPCKPPPRTRRLPPSVCAQGASALALSRDWRPSLWCGIWWPLPDMYGSSLIVMPDQCDLPPVKRQRKKNAALVSVPTPTPLSPRPASSKGFKQKSSTYRISAAPSGRGRCRRCRAIIAKGETRLEVCAFVRPGRYTLLLRCTVPACIDTPLATAILSVYKQAERMPVDAALEGSPEAQRVVRAITCAGLDAQ